MFVRKSKFHEPDNSVLEIPQTVIRMSPEKFFAAFDRHLANSRA